MKPIILFALVAGVLTSCNTEQKQTNKNNRPTFELGEIVRADSIELYYEFPSDIKLYLDTCEKPWANQKAGTEYSYIGMERETDEQFYGKYGKPRPMSNSDFAVFKNAYKPVNAKTYILNRAAKEQVLIINEAHHKPKHRFFTRSLLEELYNNGFRYLGLETLTNRGEISDFELNQRKYPIKLSGTYSKEPQFGNLIREALEIGYTLFPYEGEGNGKPREINQAKNIVAFMEKNKNGKYLIHCGYAHATEGQMQGSWEKAMAGRLTEYTGINPLTVNQTKFDNRFDFSYLNPLSKRLNISEPTVFLDSNQLSYLGKRNDSAFDIMVFHEQAKYEIAKPNWLVENENVWIRIPDSLVNLKKPYFAMAILQNEYGNEAIPYDLDVLTKEKEEILLALKPGLYTLHFQNKLDSAARVLLKVN
tara:strand:- start:98 stop:1354 length:1257 start_codon:yes stop_codon:yes gene_type:complete